MKKIKLTLELYVSDKHTPSDVVHAVMTTIENELGMTVHSARSVPAPSFQDAIEHSQRLAREYRSEPGKIES